MSGSWCSKEPTSSLRTLQLFLSACAQSSRDAMKRASTRSAGTWKRTYRPHVMRRPHEDGRPRSRRQWEGMARRAVDVATDPHRRHHALAIWWHQAPKQGARHQSHRNHRTRAGGCSSRRGAGRGSSSVPQIHCTKVSGSYWLEGSANAYRELADPPEQMSKLRQPRRATGENIERSKQVTTYTL